MSYNKDDKKYILSFCSSELEIIVYLDTFDLFMLVKLIEESKKKVHNNEL